MPSSSELPVFLDDTFRPELIFISASHQIHVHSIENRIRNGMGILKQEDKSDKINPNSIHTIDMEVSLTVRRLQNEGLVPFLKFQLFQTLIMLH